MDASLEEVFDLIESGEYDAALRVLQVISPERLDRDERVEYIRCISQCLSQTDRFLDAERVLQEGLRQFPEDVRLLCELGIVLSESGREVEARAHLERVVALAPDDTAIAYHYGYVLEKLRCLEEAVTQYRRVLEADPSYDWAYLRLAECLGDLDDEGGAVAAYEEYLQRSPEDGEAWIGLGILHSDAQRYEEAGACYAHAEGLCCDKENLYYNGFITSLRQEDDNGIAQNLERLRDVKPDGSRIRFAEAYLAQRAGDLEMVRLRCWQAAGRSLNEDGDQGEDGFTAAMSVFRDYRWIQDAKRLFRRALVEEILNEDFLTVYNEIVHDEVKRGVWCSLVVSAHSPLDLDAGRRYTRCYEVEAPNRRVAEKMAVDLETDLGGQEGRVERVHSVEKIRTFHPGVVWVDRVVRSL